MTYRMNARFNSKQGKSLSELAIRLGWTKADVLREALALLEASLIDASACTEEDTVSNPGSGYNAFGLFFRNDGQIEINNVLMHPDKALVKVFTSVPKDQQAKALAEIKAHRVRCPFRQRIFNK